MGLKNWFFHFPELYYQGDNIDYEWPDNTESHPPPRMSITTAGG
jgi:hypothetical protein